MGPVTACAHPNIAFIKYWGNKDDHLRLPSNGSISMNLFELETVTSVEFDTNFPGDQVVINGLDATGDSRSRVIGMINEVRNLAGKHLPARVDSRNNFPAGAGIASSSSAFAALALASSFAAGLEFSQLELSCLARHGSGSACRSIPGGFVEWKTGVKDADSFAFSIASPDHWDLVDCIAVSSCDHKSIGSTAGHALAQSSPLQKARVMDCPRRLDICRSAIIKRDLSAFGSILEEDSFLMHAVMMTSNPALLYWQPATLSVLHSIQAARKNGLHAWCTVDAGPNVHVICEKPMAEDVFHLLINLPGILEVIKTTVGGPAKLIEISS
jgi:diphosphomevalonate decarboxylase